MSSSVADRTTKVKPSDQTSEIPELGVEQGIDSSLPFTTPFNPVGLGLKRTESEELQEVLQDEWEVRRPTVRQLTTMRRLDGHARALYRLLTLPLRASLGTATFNPADGGEEEAEFIEQVFRTAPTNGGMTTTFQRFLGQLLSALFEGFSAFEKVFWIPDRGPLKGKITLQKLAYRPASSVTFIADRTGGFAGIRQRAVVGGRTIDVYIEPEYCFYYAAQEDERKFYGVSFFESAFPHYDAKAKAYFTAHLAAQRAAVGTRVGTVPPNASATAKREFAQNLGNLALAQWMMMPEGFKVDVLRESGNFDFLNLINHHNHMMSESILANFFDSDTGGGSAESGSLVNFAQPGDDMFVLMLRAIMDDLANHINHYLIPQLVDYNFNGSKYPTFAWGAFTDEQRAAISTTFDKLATSGAGMNVSTEFMRELEKTMASEMGLSIDWEAVEAREAEEKAAQAALDAGGMAPGVETGPLGMDPTAGAIPEVGLDGQPLPAGAEGAVVEPVEMTDEELSSLDSLADVVEMMAERADQIADSRGLPAAEESAVDPTKVSMSGISDDMIDWASHMLTLSEVV